MNNDDPGSSTSAQSTTAVVPVVLPLREIGNKSGLQWTLTLLPTHLALADAPGAQPYVILREQVMKSAMLVEGTRGFSVEQPRKMIFQLTKEGVVALADWIGESFLAAFYLKRRYGSVQLWAALLVMGSLIALLPNRAGGVMVPFEPVLLVSSLLMLIAAGFARWKPHPVLFLVDSAWFSFMAARLAIGVINGRSKGWLLMVALLAWVAVNGVKHFFRFRHMKIEPLKK